MPEIVREYRALGRSGKPDVYRGQFLRMIMRKPPKLNYGVVSFQMFDEFRGVSHGLVQVRLKSIMEDISQFFSMLGYDLIIKKVEI